MVQEAKRDCYGHWYLPAGRMEAGESIQEALRREVKEEAGLECEPITMLLVEEQRQKWIRFTFLAEVTGQSGHHWYLAEQYLDWIKASNPNDSF